MSDYGTASVTAGVSDMGAALKKACETGGALLQCRHSDV